MTAVTASAPGKIILFGEHAVVYGEPALAVPIKEVQATATVREGIRGKGLIIEALDLDSSTDPSTMQAATEALTLTARLVLDRLSVPELDGHITVRSSIPMASGLGSGAAVSAALARALAAFLNAPLGSGDLSSIVYEVEKLHHGTPSGIDNTVVCYAEPVYFVRGKTPETFRPVRPFHLVIGDTGIASPTRITVGAVREAWQREPQTCETTFKEIGEIARQARRAIETGDFDTLGPLMNRNQSLLKQLDVSSPELELLIHAAQGAGANGAKLSGGGRGGNMIALAPPETVSRIVEALKNAGARRVIHTVVD